MKAEDARKLSEAYKAPIDKVYESIKRQAAKGERSIQVQSSGFEELDIKLIMMELAQNGFNVRRERDGDQRDNWDYILITW